MSSTRRDFLQRSATAAAAITLGAPMALDAAAETVASADGASAKVPAIAAFEA